MVRYYGLQTPQIQLFFTHFNSVMAAMSVANIVKTSLGPVGLDKMLVDDVGVSAPALICDNR